MSMLLSLILLSCMVASNREIANINSSSTSLAMSNSSRPNIVSEDVYMNTLKGNPIYQA